MACLCGSGARDDPQRARIPFRAVNRRGFPDYDAGLQRHHLLPRQLLQRRSFAAMFDALGPERLGFGDFRRNGLLLPAAEGAALRLALPLHRGPHRSYNEMVIERVGRVEGVWSALRLRAPEVALALAGMQLALLQRMLRENLLGRRRRFLLNRRDPLGQSRDFTELDAMADRLWRGTQGVEKPAFAAKSTFA